MGSGVDQAMQVPSSFILCTWSHSVSSSFQSCCHVLSFGIKHNHVSQGWILPSPSLVGSQTSVQYYPGRRFDSGTPSLLHSIGKIAKDGDTWELIRGLGILVHYSPPDCSLSSANLLYREDFLLSVRSRRDLVSDKVVSFVLTTRRCLGLKTHQDVSLRETTFTFLTHARMLLYHEQAYTALASNTQHSSEDGIPVRECDDSFSPTYLVATATSFPRKFIFFRL